jgi:hypothetical protein
MLLILVLIVVVPLLFAAVSALVLVGTLWFQGYIYTEPARGLLWRAPVAVLAVALFLTGWTYFVGKSQGHLGTLTDFYSGSDEEFTELWLTDRDGKDKDAEGRTIGHFKRSPGQPYRYADGLTKQVPGRPDGILVKGKDKDEKVLFKPDRDADGNFKVEEVSGIGGAMPQSLKYRDDKGRVLEEGKFTEISSFGYGRLIVNILLNGLHLIVWWLCLWLLLEFQWSHAFGIAVLVWLTTMLLLLPPLFSWAGKGYPL